MTVKRLLEILKDLPEDYKIVISDPEYYGLHDIPEEDIKILDDRKCVVIEL